MNFDESLNLLTITLCATFLATPPSIILVLALEIFTECSEKLKTLMPRNVIRACGVICFTLIFLYYMHAILM